MMKIVDKEWRGQGRGEREEESCQTRRREDRKRRGMKAER